MQLVCCRANPNPVYFHFYPPKNNLLNPLHGSGLISTVYCWSIDMGIFLLEQVYS